MDIEKIKEIIQVFFSENGINMRIEKSTQSTQLYSIYVRILNNVRIKRILNFEKDIAFILGLKKIEIKVDCESMVSISIPKKERDILDFENSIKKKEFKNFKGDLKFLLGENTNGELIVKNLIDMTHLLIAGQTGSGKSVFLNTLILSLVDNKNTDFIMVDTKKVELSIYKELNSLIFPICTDSKSAISSLNWLVTEMNKRYTVFQHYGVRNIEEYNQINKKNKMRRIVMIIDELADLMMSSSKSVEALICKIAQLSRASGIHLVISTQRPSHDVITGLIKANLPTRISFTVNSKVNSRVILDQNGAEQLLGKGDMLYLSTDNFEPLRLQGAYISTKKIEEMLINKNSKIKKRIKKEDILLEMIIKYLKNREEKTFLNSELIKAFKLNEADFNEILKNLEEKKIITEYCFYAPRKILI